MIENIEHFHTELDVEVLRNSADMGVLKDGEVQAGHTRADQNIAAGIAAQVESLQRGGIDRAADARRRGVAVGIPKRRVGSGWYGEALRLDVGGGVAGIGKRCATGSPEAIRVGKIVAAQRVGGITAGSPSRREGNAVTNGEDGAKLPTIGNPAGRAGEGLGSGDVPSAVDDQRAADVEVGGPTGQSHIEPFQAGDRITEGVASEGR